MSDASEPTFVAHYELLDELGRGGMGIVYRAHDRTLDRIVALKRPSDEAADDPEKRRRFLREARAASRLAHPHIVPVHAVLEHEDVPWIVMELVEGRSLRAYIDERGPLPLAEALRHAEALADALSAAHERGVLHRDVNPKNILLAHDGRALLADFGLARILDSAGSDDVTRSMNLSTSDGRVLGTPGYMAPEQILGQSVDARTDIFALGAVLFEMCSGTKAFPGAARGDVAYAILHREPNLESAGVAAPQELHQIIRKATAKSPGDRYPSARELVADLGSLRRRLESDSYLLERAPDRFAALRSRRGAIMALVVALAIVGGGIASRGLFRPAAPFHERDWLLITDFENTTGERAFDETLREALEVALSQSSYVNVVPKSRVADALRRMRREAAAPVDAATGREISLREGFHMLLGGSIRGSGGAYQILVQAREPQTSRIVLAESERFNDAKELFTRVDALARRVRAGLGESLDRIDRSSRPLEQVTTSSLDALQLYASALAHVARGEVSQATALLNRALEHDPRFAMAHFELARNLTSHGEIAKAADEYIRAHELRDGVTEREAALIIANYHIIQFDYPIAIETLQTAANQYPDERAIRSELATVYDATGRIHEAIAEAREALRLDPLDIGSHARLALVLVTGNKPDEALAALASAQARGLSSPRLEWSRGLAWLAVADREQAGAAFQRLVAAGSPHKEIGELCLTRMAIYEGRLKDAAAQLSAGILADRHRGNAVYEAERQLLRANVRWLQRDIRGAREDVSAVLTRGGEAGIAFVLFRAGHLLVATGDVPQARNALRRLQALHGGRLTTFENAWSLTLEGDLLAADGHLDEAVQLFRRSARERAHYRTWRGLASALEKVGDPRGAAEAWRAVVGAQGEILRVGFPADWPLAQLELGRTLRKLGEPVGARASYDKFLDLWKEADAGALVEGARKERAELDLTGVSRAELTQKDEKETRRK